MRMALLQLAAILRREYASRCSYVREDAAMSLGTNDCAVLRVTLRLMVAVALAVTHSLIMGGCFQEKRREPPPPSWIQSMHGLCDLLLGYYGDNDSFPYDPRGAEYALFKLVQYAKADTVLALTEERWGAGYLPFRPEPKESRVTALRVDYLNPKPGRQPYPEYLYGDWGEPVVLLVCRYEVERPKSLLLIGSDLSVYKIWFGAGAEPKVAAAAYLGMSLVELSRGHVTEHMIGLRPAHPAVKIINREKV